MKERVTISVQPEVLEIARAEVRAGKSPSVSASVEDALRRRGKRQAIRKYIELWEEEFGPITEEERKWARQELERALGRPLSSTRER